MAMDVSQNGSKGNIGGSISSSQAEQERQLMYAHEIFESIFEHCRLQEALFT